MLSKKENLLLAYEGERPEYVPCFFDGAQILPFATGGDTPQLGLSEGIDGYGVHQTASPDAGGMFVPTAGREPVLPLDKITEWKNYVKIPDMTTIPHAQIVAGIEQMMHTDREHCVQDCFMSNGIFERLHFLMGYENAMIAIMEEPEAVYDLVGALADKKIEDLKIVKEYYKPDYVTYLDDYAYRKGLMMSKETFRKIFKPHIARIVQAADNLGLKYKEHCCGTMQDLFDDFLDLGITRFDPIQPYNDLIEMRKRAGKKVCLMGGLDLQYVIDRQDVTDEAIRQEAKRCCETYAGDGYIVYGASVRMFTAEEYMPGGALFKLNRAVEEFGHCM